MTIDHPVRRLLARVCSAETMARVVDPTLADMRSEPGRPAWLGYLSLAKTLGLHTVTSTHDALGRVYIDDRQAIPKMAWHALIWALLLAAPLVATPFVQSWVRVRFPGFLRPAVSPLELLFLLPQGLALTLPAALLMAIPLALTRLEPSPRLARRTIALSIGCAGLTFVLIGWVLPETNQAYRVLVSGDQRLTRGWSDNGFGTMRREIDRMRTFHGSETVVRRLTYGYQQRVALAAAAIPIGLLALAITVRFGRTRRSWLAGLAGFAFYVAIFFPATAKAQSLLIRVPSLPVAVLAFGPDALVAAAALIILTSRSLPFRDSPLTTAR